MTSVKGEAYNDVANAFSRAQNADVEKTLEEIYDQLDGIFNREHYSTEPDTDIMTTMRHCMFLVAGLTNRHRNELVAKELDEDTVSEETRCRINNSQLTLDHLYAIRALLTESEKTDDRRCVRSAIRLAGQAITHELNTQESPI